MRCIFHFFHQITSLWSDVLLEAGVMLSSLISTDNPVVLSVTPLTVTVDAEPTASSVNVIVITSPLSPPTSNSYAVDATAVSESSKNNSKPLTFTASVNVRVSVAFSPSSIACAYTTVSTSATASTFLAANSCLVAPYLAVSVQLLFHLQQSKQFCLRQSYLQLMQPFHLKLHHLPQQ